jgi:phage terminase small subunit
MLAGMAARPLTPKQQRFVEEYVVDGNATAAYKRAGYRAKTDKVAAANAAALLANHKVAAAIAAARGDLTARAEVTADRVLAELDTLALSDVGDVLDFTGNVPRLKPPSAIPESARRCLASVKVKRYTEGAGDDALEVEVTEFKLWDKVAALRLALQQRGLLKNVHEHTGKDGRPIAFIEVACEAEGADRGSEPA